ncbi:Hypothetical predicted protein [Paramuricea clavata]|uniref:Uncharacterized protein n=1 Tax=Paramuricea clavata TaxID=317549 RepID=A0A7D9DXQ3_PARCT|nr:Hypothetical predicted protein [Paramuricea clavata]
METQTFVHIVENCSQDASVVVRITEHVLHTLHEDSAMITNAYLRQDNAGCIRRQDCHGLCDPHVEWDGISRQNNFEYTDRKITVWEAYGVGIGRIMQQCDTWAQPLQDTFDAPFTPGGFVHSSAKKHRKETDPLTKGCALKSTRTSKCFNEFQRSCLDGKVVIGQETGQKLDAAADAKEMRYVKKKDRTRMFEAEEFLTETQIRGYFSRRAAKL